MRRMLTEFQDSQRQFVDYVDHVLTTTNKLSHAYLIETNSFSKSKELVFAFVKKLLTSTVSSEEEVARVCNLIDENGYSDLVIIEPDGAWIKKEQLLDLQSKFKTKSIFGGYRVYVIFQAEKLNASSANTLLKFLEEPEEGIIAVLVANNRYQLIDTIRSRCQVLSLVRDFSAANAALDTPILDFLESIYVNQEGTIAFVNELWYPFYKEKDEYKEAVQRMKHLYIDLLEKENDLVFLTEQYGQAIQKIIEKTSIHDIIRKLKVLEEAERRLTFNVNLKLWLDQFIIDLCVGGMEDV